MQEKKKEDTFHAIGSSSLDLSTLTEQTSHDLLLSINSISKPQKKTNAVVKLSCVKETILILPNEYYHMFKRLILSNPFPMWLMFRNLTEDKTKFVQHYLSVIQKLGITSFIEKILENEVEECNDPVTLFREDSVGIRLLDHYFHTIGGGYLATVLGPTVRKLVLESKGSPDFNYDQTTLQKELSDLITTILNSSGLIPAQLHKLLYLMYHFSVQKFPKTKHIGFNAMNG